MKTPPDLVNLHAWCLDTLDRSGPVNAVIEIVLRQIDDFVKWPTQSILLWSGCTRTSGLKHTYPDTIRAQHRATLGRFPDGRENGPAIAAFQLAGGVRPARSSGNGWNIHHLYDGKHFFPGRSTSLRAVKDGEHFTHSAGLVSVHPIADALADEDAGFAWFLRAEAFLRFAYDPDGVFEAVADVGHTVA